MNFIERTRPEYQKMRRTLVWRAPFITLWRFLLPLSLFLLLLELTYIASHQTGAWLTLWLIFIANALCLLLIPFRFRRLAKAHVAFCEKVKHLTAAQQEGLMGTYETRRKADVYTRKKGAKKRKASNGAAIYLTDDFIFVPGLMLLFHEELADIKLTIAKQSIAGWPVPIRTSRIYFVLKHPSISPKEAKKIDFLYGLGSFEGYLKANAVQLPLKYSYDKSPETAEQILAWFWQKDPLDPTLAFRTKQIVLEYFSDNPPNQDGKILTRKEHRAAAKARKSGR